MSQRIHVAGLCAGCGDPLPANKPHWREMTVWEHTGDGRMATAGRYRRPTGHVRCIGCGLSADAGRQETLL